MNGLLPVLLVKFAMALPVIPGQHEVTVNPHFVSWVQPAFCPKPTEGACSNIILGNGDRVHVVGSVEEVSAKLAAPQ